MRRAEKPVITIHQAVEILDALCSAEDPILFRGVEGSPSRFLGGCHDWEEDGDAKKVTVMFYRMSDRHSGRLRRGSVYAMVLDRLGVWTGF